MRLYRPISSIAGKGLANHCVQYNGTCKPTICGPPDCKLQGEAARFVPVLEMNNAQPIFAEAVPCLSILLALNRTSLLV
jgi:hypothetical protein